MRFDSSFNNGDQVVLFAGSGVNLTGKVEAVSFRKRDAHPGKVTYDIALDIGGETLRNVDSSFVGRLAADVVALDREVA